MEEFIKLFELPPVFSNQSLYSHDITSAYTTICSDEFPITPVRSVHACNSVARMIILDFAHASSMIDGSTAVGDIFDNFASEGAYGGAFQYAEC